MGDIRSAQSADHEKILSQIKDHIVCDATLPWSRPFLPPGARIESVLERFWKSGISHVSITVAAGKDNAQQALSELAMRRTELAAIPDVVFAASSAEIRAAKAQKRLSVSFHFQSGVPLQEEPALVEPFRALGVTRAIIAYNERNALGDGCHEQGDAGLSARGRAVIAQMNRWEMMVDVTHCGLRTSLEAIEASERPAVFSHSNARALFDHERNITDEQIKSCAGRGGIIGINGVGFFLGAEGASIPATMADHAAHIADLVGPGFVGLGIDFMYLENSDYSFFHENAGRWPRGYPSPPWSFLQPEQFPDLVNELMHRGFSGAELRGILGENYLRVVDSWTIPPVPTDVELTTGKSTLKRSL